MPCNRKKYLGGVYTIKGFLFRMPDRIEVGYSKSKQMIKIIKDLKVLLNYDEIFGIGEGKAIECLIGKKSNPISDLFYLNSIKLVMENLFSAVKNG